MNKINNIFFSLLSLFSLAALFMLQACKKDKIDFVRDNRNLTENRVSSTARIINLGGFNQVIAEGDSLTSFVVQNPNTPDGHKYPGTSYFPSDGRLGKIWNIPQDLFDAGEKVQLHLASRNYQGSNDNDLELEVANNYQQATDYYLMPTLRMNGQPAVVPIERGVSAPSKPDHFKVRIVNLSGAIKVPGFNSSGMLEDLTGNVSLAYADGTLVNPQTSDISSARKTSEYIELPYGTYQFKVLMQDGRQMPALGAEEYAFTVIDPPTSTIPLTLMKSTDLTYAPVQTYQPGGIYTVLIAPQSYNYMINEIGETAVTYQNSFQVIADNNAPVNQTYFRVQAANAWDVQAVSFRINGKAIASGIGFGQAGEYVSLVHGSHTVEAVDVSGKVIASAEQVLRPAQNYTAWLYPDHTGAAKLLLVANDLSGTTYSGGTAEDATFGRNQYRFFFFKRFLNFSGDNPYITFTLNNGQAVAGNGDNAQAGLNMQPGIPLYERPFASGAYAQGVYELMAYRSFPNVVPGIWADDIPVLKNDAFIANNNLYERAGRRIPVHEAGIYTVALIGKSGTGSTAETKAKMIIIKHNK